MDKLTRTDIKRINRSEIFNFIYHEHKTSKQEIANRLQMSLPTVSQNLKELEDLGLIEKKGQFESTGGRKANAITFINDAKITIGIEIAKHWIAFVATDLYGHILKKLRLPICYENAMSYYETLGNTTNTFIDSLDYSADKILGIGIAIQGLISSDYTEVVYGKILNCTGLKIDNFSKCISYPCKLIHDAECAARTELWFCQEINDAIYLSLSHNLGGAIIVSGQIHKGTHGRSGLIEHITVDTNGELCYCGKRGCLETYCAARVLIDDGVETLEDFFNLLRQKDLASKQKWSLYLEHLATAINNLHMTIDCDVILGGHIAPYLIDEDIEKLHALLIQKSTFTIEQPFIQKSHCSLDAIPIGATLPYISEFLTSI